MNLADIKRNGYPCSGSEFWWMVDELVKLQAELDAATLVTRRLLGDWFIDGQNPDYPELWVSAATPTQHDHITDAERDWLCFVGAQ